MPDETPNAQEVINTLNLANQALINEIMFLRAVVGRMDNSEMDRINSVINELQGQLVAMTEARDRAAKRVGVLQMELDKWEKGSSLLPGNRLNTVD